MGYYALVRVQTCYLRIRQMISSRHWARRGDIQLQAQRDPAQWKACQVTAPIRWAIFLTGHESDSESILAGYPSRNGERADEVGTEV